MSLIPIQLNGVRWGAKMGDRGSMLAWYSANWSCSDRRGSICV